MAITKQAIIDAAFEELALAGFTFDITAAERATALLRLDSMMATWEGRGLRFGYFFSSATTPSALANDSGLPQKYHEAAYTNLAVRLCATFGKQPPVSLLATAKDAMTPLLIEAAFPDEQLTRAGVPRGAGNSSVFGSSHTTEPMTSSISLDLQP
jgi:hypothetical protein